MTFLLRTIDFTADGREIARDRTLNQPVLTLGRTADNDIHLADLAVEPQQARISDLGNGRIRVESIGTLGFFRDGQPVMDAEIAAARGAELKFGSHRITVAAEGERIVLTVQRVDAVSEASEEKDEVRNFSLAGTMPSKRVQAWIAALAVLIAFLAVPVVSNLLHDPAGKQGVAGDASWSAGPLSAAHQKLEKNCTACHVKPFESVRDAACQSCHKQVHDHAAPAMLLTARQTPGLGGRFLEGVGHMFGRPGPVACATCHIEHEGQAAMMPTGQQFCADCHGGMKQRLPKTPLGDASDFGTLHPQFNALVHTSLTDGKAVKRVSLDSKPRDVNGLKFPHDVHLKTNGAVARMARNIGKSAGYGGPLDCADCHTPNADGVSFAAVKMEENCGACHSLAFDRVGGIVRTLRHGDVAQMIGDLRALGRNRVGSRPDAGLPGRQRPGQYAGGGRYHADFAPLSYAATTPAGAAMAAFNRDGLCAECHVVSHSGGAVIPWSIAPVHQTPRFFTNGWFDHKAHEEEKCTSCHKAGASSSSADLLLPGIAQCRDCHMGPDDIKADVPSGCAMCHSYHPTNGVPPMVRDKAKKAIRTAHRE